MKTYPLLQSQMSVFMGWLARPMTTAWNLPSRIVFPKSVGLKRLREAAERITRHKATHTRFVNTGTTIRQYIDPSMTIPIPTRQMTEAEAEEYMAHDFVNPFQPFGDKPLCRIEIIETPQRLLLLTDYHHTIADGTSIVRMMLEDDEEGQMEMTEAAEAEVEAFKTDAYKEARKRTLDHFRCTELTTFATPSMGKVSPWGQHLIASYMIERSHIDEWCQAHQLKVSIVFTAAFSIALAKLTHQHRVAFFTLTHGRTDGRMRHSFGMFVRSLPLMADTDGELPVMEFIQRMQHEQRTALKNNIYPATHFCRDIQAKPAITFGFQGREIEEVCWLDGIPYQGKQLSHKEACNDLNCTIYSSSSNYEIRTDASEALINQATLKMVAQAVATCLQQFMERPDGRLKDISLIDNDEQQRLITLGQGERTNPRSPKEQKGKEHREPTWTDLFQKQATLTPDHIAVVASNGKLTYRELDEQSTIYAEKLNEQGKALAKQGKRNSPFVCLTTTRKKEWMVQVIGVMKAGLAFVPIDEEWPEERRKQIINDILHPGSNTEDQQSGTTQISQEHVTYEAPSTLAYMIYTSGSTGKPKGVMITHRGLLNLTNFIVRRWHLTATSRISCHAPFTFDASIEDLFPVLTVGGTLYIVPDDIRMNLSALAQYLKDNGITGGCYTTSLGVMLAEKHHLEVDYLCVGGEKLNPPHVSTQGSPAYPAKYRIINTYGPTECTVDATFYELKPSNRITSLDAEGMKETTIPIGKPLDNMLAFVVDHHGQLLPQGAVGELWIAGPQVAAGYWNEPKLTSEKFTSCPFCKGTVYHTGDLVRWNEDGLLEFIGRNDRQIKRNGFRIEPEEIAAALLQLERINQAVVSLATPIKAERQETSTTPVKSKELLCAYFTADEDMDAEDIRLQLKKHLPDYLIPDAFMQLPEIPLTANGKTDFKLLPNPLPATRQHVKPANGQEQLLCQAFAKALLADQVGATDNFFDLGGTSLSVMLLLGEMQKMGFLLTYQDVCDNPTPRKLSFLQLKESGRCCNKTEALPQREKVGWSSRTACCNSIATHLSLNGEGQERAPFFLTGATGFLGIHILRELITHDAQQVCCLVRDKEGMKAEERLRLRIQYYFGEESPLLSLIGNRIQVVCGDITSSLSFSHIPFPSSKEESRATSTRVDGKESHPSTTLIHCAADVRYFAQGSSIEDTNIKGTENVIRFCLDTGTRLIHISTTSLNTTVTQHGHLGKTFFGQQGKMAKGVPSLPYIQSKRAAEELVMKAIQEQQLEAHIIRIGSLMPRLSDGMFQINAQDNLFMRLLNVIQKTGICSESLADYPIVCAPVDVVAEAIVNGCYATKPPTQWVDATPHPLCQIIAERNGGDNCLRLVSDQEFLSFSQLLQSV